MGYALVQGYGMTENASLNSLNHPFSRHRRVERFFQACARRRLAHFGEITVRIGTRLTFAPGNPPGEIARQLETTVKSL